MTALRNQPVPSRPNVRLASVNGVLLPRPERVVVERQPSGAAFVVAACGAVIAAAVAIGWAVGAIR